VCISFDEVQKHKKIFQPRNFFFIEVIRIKVTHKERMSEFYRKKDKGTLETGYERKSYHFFERNSVENVEISSNLIKEQNTIMLIGIIGNFQNCFTWNFKF
jgi:hypothetical protein